VGKKKDKVTVAVNGIGAANVAILRLLFADGFKPQNFIVVDSKGTLHTDRKDLEAQQKENPYKWTCARELTPQRDLEARPKP